MARIKAPVEGYNGRIGDVEFRDGVAETDNLSVISYCRNAGYEVDGETAESGEPAEPVDSRDVERVELATPLRDAAVQPEPRDFLPPTNAGQADPHGPAVVAPGVHAAPPAPIVPGPVSSDPAAQQEAETEMADRVLVQGEAATSATGQDQPPAQSAPKAEWVAYASRHHDNRDELEAMTKAELIKGFGRRREG